MNDPEVERSESEAGAAVAGGGPDSTALRRGGSGLRFITREELAEILQISLRTVDAMVAAEEVPFVRLRGAIVRFYLPDVVRHLTASALTRKRGQRARTGERD